MDGLVGLVQEPAFIVAASTLLLAVSVMSFVAFHRAGKARVARDAATAQVAGLRKQLEAVLASARDGVVVTSAAGDIIMMSEVAGECLGVSAAEAIGRPVARLGLRAIDAGMHPLNLQEVLSARYNRGDDPRVVGVPGRRGGDDVRWLQVSTVEVSDADPSGPVSVALIVDSTGTSDATEATNRSDQQFRKAIENAPLPMALVDLEWHLMEVNRAFAEMLGSTVAALRGTPFAALSHPADVSKEREHLQRLYDGTEARFAIEKRFVKSDGLVTYASLSVGLVRHPGGAPDHYIVQLRDTTQDRVHSDQLAHAVEHDPLTRLANRTLMNDVLEKAVGQPDAIGRVAVLAVDLDGFKGLNDRFGHAVGDDALFHTARVLEAAAGRHGKVARIGGDEFVVIIDEADAQLSAVQVAEAIHEGLRKPLSLKRHQLNLHASVGIALADSGTLADGMASLLNAADAAMYRAKAAGKSRTEMYVPSMRIDAEAHGALISELRHAIDHGDLVLHYQPILELSDRTVVGYEALVRWQHPTRGLLLPGAFLPLMNDRQLSTDLGAVLVEQVAEFLVENRDSHTWVSLNVSADQLGDSEFADRVLTSIARHNLSPHRLVIELTEASLVSPNTRIRHELTELRNAGIPILLDDFGTGVSPLSYLRDLPVSGVKLDMSFTAGIPEDPAGARVSRALGALARELGLATIAEGIETESQAEYLRSCGWRYGQGWLFGVAQPASVTPDASVRFSKSLIDPRPNDDEMAD
jgi:diguanylate cyclase (GGDEF)-like protein/PAS domain S-box-containing protein